MNLQRRIGRGVAVLVDLFSFYLDQRSSGRKRRRLLDQRGRITKPYQISGFDRIPPEIENRLPDFYMNGNKAWFVHGGRAGHCWIPEPELVLDAFSRGQIEPRDAAPDTR
jgi:hypothetical protein